MAIEEVRPYIASKLTALGLAEHLDGFADDNIPTNIIDYSFHQIVGDVSVLDTTAKGVGMSVPVAVRVFVKGFRDPYTKITEAQVLGESIIKSVCNFTSGRSGSITQIYFDSMAVVALDSVENDNLIVIELSFDAVLFLCFE